MSIYYNVIVVGAGGTGGNFLKEFGRFLSFFSNPDVSVTLSIVDGDKVEKKNCERQPFIVDDENEFKSVTMASAIIENFNLPEHMVFSYTNYINAVDDLKKIADRSRFSVNAVNRNSVIILVGAVDNHRARQVMNKFFYSCENIIYIDSANEFRVGEVVTGVRMQNIDITPPRAYYYPEILKDKGRAAGELSCGEINIAQPQHITTNLMAANIILSTVCNSFSGVVSGGITYFDSSKFFSRFDAFQGKCPSKSSTKRKKVKN